MNNSVHSPLSGVGGWLAWLVFSLMVLSPLTGAANIAGAEADSLAANPALQDSETFRRISGTLWLCWKISASVSVATGFALWKLRTRTTVRNVLIAWWGSWLVTTYLQAVTVNSLATNASAGQWIGETAGSVLILLVWSAYLVRSKRVKNTYTL